MRRDFTLQNTIYSHYVVMNRVVKRIAHAFRAWKMRVRINSLANIAKYASSIDSNVLYLE